MSVDHRCAWSVLVRSPRTSKNWCSDVCWMRTEPRLGTNHTVSWVKAKSCPKGYHDCTQQFKTSCFFSMMGLTCWEPWIHNVLLYDQRTWHKDIYARHQSSVGLTMLVTICYNPRKTHCMTIPTDAAELMAVDHPWVGKNPYPWGWSVPQQGSGQK